MGPLSIIVAVFSLLLGPLGLGSIGAGGLFRPYEAATCSFVLGFATLDHLIPSVIGSCLDNEQHDPVTGDALQHTTNGLLVWRKSDNFTAFTDGYHTWVNGPNGVQERLNSQRFSWEANPTRLPVVATAAPAVTATARCQFVNGFLMIQRQIPAIVGDCVDNEHTDPTSGDIIQHTTEGILVYQKSDGTLAFSDGSDTWVEGPDGLRERPNNERFSWEANPQDLPVVQQ
ncbi:MAG: hypothetical protein M1296_02250 [Chloroflexi bacterium]|nr:hypothetical protein [Chloroflexota bacterium]